MRWKVITLFLLALINLSCLNVFSPIDSPSGDAQFLSLARACFDQGDVDCANKYYGKISGTTEAETAAAEEAFTILDKNGATMGALMQSLGSGKGAEALNKLTELLKPGAGEAKRLSIFDAYKKVDAITVNKELKGLVRFMSAFSMAAEILAEYTNDDGILRKTDLAKDPTVCKSTDAAVCFGAAACAPPSGNKIPYVAGDITITSASTADLSGAASLKMFNGTMGAINTALGATELGASGKFQTGTGGFVSALNTAYAQSKECYRAALIEKGLGI